MTVAEDLELACAAAVAEIMALEQELAQTQQDLTAAEDIIAGLQAVAVQRDEIIVCLSNQVDELVGTIGGKDLQIAALEGDNAELGAEVQWLNDRLATCDCPDPEPPTLEERLAPLQNKLTMGWSAKPGTKAAFDDISTRVGEPGQIRRVFPSGEQDFESDYAAGRIVYFEVPLDASNEEAENIAERADALYPEPWICTIGHEEEIGSKQNTPEDFLGDYMRLYPLLRQARNALVGTTVMNSSLRGNNAYVGPDVEDMREWLPTSGNVDFLGCDLYIGNTANLPFASPANQLLRPIAFAEELGVPLMYGEFSIAGTSAQRSQYLEDFITYISALTGIAKPLVLQWFNSNIGNNVPVVYPPTTPETKSWDIDRCANVNPDTLTPAVFRSYML